MLVHFDAVSPKFDVLFANNPDYIFYFATPKIFVKRSKSFEKDLYNNFNLFYVETFKAILDKCVTLGVKGVFYPSSVAVVEDTGGLLEYIKSKLEGESLCKEYNDLRDFTVLFSRLPRTLTDQTATHLSIESKDPFDVLMPILEDFLP
jgi:nucleoside-diphosphate-sugar epimerase